MRTLERERRLQTTQSGLENANIERTHPYFKARVLRYDTDVLDLGDAQIEIYLTRARGHGDLFITTAGDVTAIDFGVEVKIAESSQTKKRVSTKFRRGRRTFFLNDHNYRFRIDTINREGAELTIRSTHEFRATPVHK